MPCNILAGIFFIFEMHNLGWLHSIKIKTVTHEYRLMVKIQQKEKLQKWV